MHKRDGSADDVCVSVNSVNSSLILQDAMVREYILYGGSLMMSRVADTRAHYMEN